MCCRSVLKIGCLPVEAIRLESVKEAEIAALGIQIDWDPSLSRILS